MTGIFDGKVMTANKHASRCDPSRSLYFDLFS